MPTGGRRGPSTRGDPGLRMQITAVLDLSATLPAGSRPARSLCPRGGASDRVNNRRQKSSADGRLVWGWADACRLARLRDCAVGFGRRVPSAGLHGRGSRPLGGYLLRVCCSRGRGPRREAASWPVGTRCAARTSQWPFQYGRVKTDGRQATRPTRRSRSRQHRGSSGFFGAETRPSNDGPA